ncbi:MAG: MFS transporter [Chloroflexota bacterium]|nr:MFS transporter [Chloroflexota bacterium]
MNRDLILIAIALFTWGIGEGSFYYFQPLYLEEMGASPISIGTILGAAGIAMTIAHIPAGYLADQFGRRKLLWLAWIIGLTAAWLMALAKTLPVFISGLLLYSLTMFIMSPLSSYITAARGKWSVGQALTSISATYNAGAVIGPLIGGFIGNNYGLKKTYLFAACIISISAIVAINLGEQPIEPKNTNNGNSLTKNRTYMSYLVVIFLAMFAMYMPQPLTPNFLQNERGLSLDTIGQICAAGNLGNVFLNLSLGRLSPSVGFLLGQIGVGMFSLLIWQAPGIPWYFIGYFMLGGYRTARSLASAQVQTFVDRANMGLVYGITETISASAAIIVPPIAGVIYDWKPEAIYPLSLILVIVSLLVSVVFTTRESGTKKATE